MRWKEGRRNADARAGGGHPAAAGVARRHRQAPTGTGKTFAFGIPMIEHIDPQSDDLQGLILAPTRELAIQIADELRGLLTFYKDIRVTVVYGGQRLEPQIRSLQQHPQIVVQRPVASSDHYNRKNLRLDRIKTVILDEADRMLDMGFFDDVTKILDRIKNRTNLGLFSATISQEVMTVSWMYQRDEVEITVAPTEESKPDIDQYSITVPRLEKEEAMLRILRSGALERVIVFCNTKVMCQRLSDDLRRAGIRADCLHGDIKQATREKTMADFRHGKLPVLIATDVAPAALTWTTSTASSTTTSPRRTNTISTASAARAAPGKRASPSRCSARSRRRPSWTRSPGGTASPCWAPASTRPYHGSAGHPVDRRLRERGSHRLPPGEQPVSLRPRRHGGAGYRPGGGRI